MSSIDATWFIYQGELYVGADIRWKLGQVHGHARHTWIMDDFELGRRPAEEYAHASWIGDAGRTVTYQFKMIEIDAWLESPEGQEEMAMARAQLGREGS